MNFNLIRPCAECPFRTDVKGYLRGGRAREIANSLLRDATFTCHKTNEYDDDGEPEETSKSEHCAGALILLEKMGMPNQMMRIAGRLRFYDPEKLDMDAPVFDCDSEFVDHHAQSWKERKAVNR